MAMVSEHITRNVMTQNDVRSMPVIGRKSMKKGGLGGCSELRRGEKF